MPGSKQLLTLTLPAFPTYILLSLVLCKLLYIDRQSLPFVEHSRSILSLAETYVDLVASSFRLRIHRIGGSIGVRSLSVRPRA
jgi:hypothetical protein